MHNHCGRGRYAILPTLGRCGMWLTLISLFLGILWIWFGDTLKIVCPQNAALIETIGTNILLTNALLFAAYWMMMRFRSLLRDAKTPNA